MTAYKVIDSHFDLSDIGSMSHNAIDLHISGTQFIVLSSSLSSPSSKLLLTGPGIKLIETSESVNVSVDKNFIKSMFSFQEVPFGLADGQNAEFILGSDPQPQQSLMLYINGILQSQNNDYTLSGSNILLLWPPRSGSNIFATYQK